MNPISLGVKNIFGASVHLLNQPMVKEGVKSIASSVTFVFGLVEIYDIYQIAYGRKISTEVSLSSSKWVQVANKVLIVCTKISLVLSLGVSRPGVFIISSLIGSVFSTAQLDRAFGPNTLFAVNPWHPRHVISISAVMLALPSAIQSTYKGFDWVHKKIQQHQNTPTKHHNVQPWLTDTKVQLMAFFNAFTSRPVLHIGNHLGRIA